ncbi:MAG TPA: DegT/DnrJ/EryC1/StrS family aminotransferase [Bryobacteraceae bacterium]|nr:DegT/DnrJ/EryC1/StrS family aminotransferase [Bryobacteraceae bacterium]
MSTQVTSRAIPLLDLRRQFDPIRDEVMREVARVIESQRFILGEDVERFERHFAGYCRTAYAVGCASGTDALELALLALDIGPDDEVLTVPYSFYATAGAVMSVGATPVFVDVEPDTFNLDVTKLKAALAAHPKVKAILPVHLYGGCADMEAILDIAGPIPVIEDAAQSVGAEYKGRRAGSMGAMGCFSFFPTKNLGAFGDGGMLTTNDEALAKKLRALRVHGSIAKYIHEWAGKNSRLDALQAAILDVKLRHLDSWSEGRQRNAGLYRKFLAGSGAILPMPGAHQTRHIYNQFVIRVKNRDSLRAFLAEQGVGTEVYYPRALHLQPALERYGYKEGDFPVSEHLSKETLALPIFGEATEEEIRTVSELIREFLSRDN